MSEAASSGSGTDAKDSASASSTATRVPCDPGRVGEVWLQSPSVAVGYFGRPELSVECFEARTEDGDGPWLRTGDLGCVVDGELYICGRQKDLIIVRGRNVHPEDVEGVAEDASSAVRPGGAIAFAVDSAESLDGEALVVVLEASDSSQATAEAVRRAVAARFDASPQSVVFLAKQGLFRTSSGKRMRQAAQAALAVDVRERLVRLIGRPLPPSLAYDNPSVAALAKHLERAQRERPQQATGKSEGPIAVVGIGCRFPGGANDVEAYWQLLLDGKDTITEVPPSRWDLESWFDPDPETPGRTYARHGAFLDRIDCFDAPLFGVSPREARQVDPSQRIWLEVAWEALEHAGAVPLRTESSLGRTASGIGAQACCPSRRWMKSRRGCCEIRGPLSKRSFA